MAIKQYSRNNGMRLPEGASSVLQNVIIKNRNAFSLTTPLSAGIYIVYATEIMNFNLGTTTTLLQKNTSALVNISSKTVNNLVEFAPTINGVSYISNNLFQGGSWTDIIYGKNKFLLFSNSNNSNTVLIINDDGSFQSSAIPSNEFNTFKAAYGRLQFQNDMYVVVPSDSSNLGRYYSTDGISWYNTSGVYSFPGGVAFGDNIFATASQENSTDGITWNSAYGAGQSGKSIIYGGGKFVKTTTSSVAGYSTDGIIWTLTTMPTNTSWNSIAYGNGTYIAVNSLGTTKAGAASSTDAITWTSRTMPVAAIWNSIIYGNGIFTAVSGSNCAVTTNGITWTFTAMPGSPTSYGWNSQAYGNGKFLAANQTVAANLDTALYEVPKNTPNPPIVGIFKGPTNIAPSEL